MSPDQIRQLDRARLGLIDRCMTRYGFRYVIEEPPTGLGPQKLTERRYGVTDARLAASDGYGLGAADPSLQTPPAKPRLTPDGQTVLFGRGRSAVKGTKVPTGGCVGEAVRALEATSPSGADVNLGQALSAESFKRSQQDSRVRTVWGEWASCMSSRGYDYPDPLAPLSDPVLAGGSGPEGRKVALVDIECKRETNVVGVWFAVESAYQTALIHQNLPALKLSERAIAAQLAASRSVRLLPH